MSEENNIPASNEAEVKKGGMVFYPRSYHIDQDLNRSYAVGVNHKNELLAALIIPTESNQISAARSDTASTIPTFAEFSDTGRRAKNPCQCSPDNSQSIPTGVLVLEQTEYDQERSQSNDFNGLPVYVAKWASVIRDADDMPKSPVGPGYIEIGFTKSTDPSINELLLQYEEITSMIAGQSIDPLDGEEKKKVLYNRIINSRRKWFVAVMLRHLEIVKFDDTSPGSIINYARGILTKYTIKGMYGGVIFRVRDGKNIIGDLTRVCNMQFDYSSGGVADLENVLANFMKFNGNKISREVTEKGYTLEAIPTIRINCGPKGTDKFSEEFNSPNTPKVMKTYVSNEFHDDPDANIIKDHGFLFADIAVRLYRIPDHKKGSGNILVSTVHAFSAPKGNYLTIDSTGESAYYFKTSKYKDPKDLES